MFTVLFKAYAFILFGMLICMLNVNNGYSIGFRYMGTGALIALFTAIEIHFDPHEIWAQIQWTSGGTPALVHSKPVSGDHKGET